MEKAAEVTKTKTTTIVDKFRNTVRFFLLLVGIGLLIFVISKDVHKSWNIFIAMMGFSAVVFIHECGHFIFAKASDIHVETFSIFLPPVLLGVRRTTNGLRFRILPLFFQRAGEQGGDGLLSFTLPIRKGSEGETEYRIGLIPLAGYVKMLGQEDTGADEQSDNPRSFGNKGVLVRMVVIASGVIFNVIAAVLLMTVVYMIGIARPPAIVGGVTAGSPAAKAGVRAGDEVIEIGGKSEDLDFTNILVAAALSDKGESVPLTVRHEDGVVESYSLVARQLYDDMPIRMFGFNRPMTLRVGAVKEDSAGLQVGDEIRYVDGMEVRSYWEFAKLVENSLAPSLVVQSGREGETGLVSSTINLELNYAAKDVNSESDLNHIYSMVPRLRVTYSSEDSGGKGLEAGDIIVAAGETGKGGLLAGDIIVAVGDIENPTYKELRDITGEHEDKELVLKVLREVEGGLESEVTVSVFPKKQRGSERVVIGIVVVLDAEHAVVAKTLSSEGVSALDIPRGATITAVDGESVSSFYDVIRELRRNAGQRVTIDYRLDSRVAGSAAVNLSDVEKGLKVSSRLADVVVFEPMSRFYKADNIGQAVVMASKKSVWFLVQTYVTVKQLFTRNVSMDSMSGPVGIATLSYQAVEQSIATFLYLLAFISANLAVINFLPIPIVDGGVFVLLIIEKIKGSPVSIKIQEVIAYVGIIFLVSVFLYLTYNDILRIVLG
ncbi:MAG: hypothetical protein FVQ80_03605 [Planctomycetes bacterium]|nr:hypothetical protein [Planctomycetota bacterium]